MFDQMASRVDLDGLETLEAIDVFRALELRRRQLEVEIAMVIGAVEKKGLYLDDGHRSVEGWCRALGKWGHGTARHAHQVARLFRDHPTVKQAAEAGTIGIDQLHEMARAAANPRCGDQFGEVADIFVKLSPKVPHDQFRLGINRWLQLADADGADQDQEESEARRRAGMVAHDGVLRISATGAGIGAAEIFEIFQHFCRAEFLHDWEATKAQYGDAATPALMPRTDAQRRFDALVAIFRAAASTPPGSNPPEPIVNIGATLRDFLDAVTATFGPTEPTPTTDHDTAVAVGAAPIETPDATDTPLGGTAPESDTDWAQRIAADTEFDPRRRRNETLSGFPISRKDLVGAAIIGWVRRVITDPRGVTLDMGRRARLLTGRQRDAVLLAVGRCTWPGCEIAYGLCQIDHLHDWADLGPTSVENSGLECGHHNRFKNRGFTVTRDAEGFWHTYRPDGTEIC